MKNRIFFVAVFIIIMTAGTTSGQETPVNMKDTVWEFSVEVGSITYTFSDSTYALTTTGLIKRAETLAIIAGVDGTGTYSVSGQTVTLTPSGGIYITVETNGDVVLKGAKSYTITPMNDTFALDAVTYKKIK